MLGIFSLLKFYTYYHHLIIGIFSPLKFQTQYHYGYETVLGILFLCLLPPSVLASQVDPSTTHQGKNGYQTQTSIYDDVLNSYFKFHRPSTLSLTPRQNYANLLLSFFCIAVFVNLFLFSIFMANESFFFVSFVFNGDPGEFMFRRRNSFRAYEAHI